MKIKTQIAEDSLVRLDIKIPWTDLSDDYNVTISDFKKNIKEPGFRAGKIPTAVVKKKYKNEIESEFIDKVLRERYQDIIKEADIDPVDSGNLIEVDFHEGDGLVMLIEVQTEPEFKLHDYKKNNLEALKYKIDVSDDDVDKAMDEIRENYAEVLNTGKGAESGNFLEVDIQELDESMAPLIGKKVEKRVIKLGEGDFGKQASEQLKGAVPGDERVVRISQEHGDHSHNYVYKFKVNHVEEHLLPEVNDEFAKKVNPSLENVEMLNERLRQDIQERYDSESLNLVNNALADEMVRLTHIEVPETMVTSYLDGLIKRAKSENKGDVDEDFLRKNYRAGAIWNMKWLMIRKSLFRKEKLEVAANEIDERMEKTAELYELDKTAAMKLKSDNDQREKVRQDIIESKVMEVLKNNSKFNEQSITLTDFNSMTHADHHH
ncbi:MAG: trigger factor [Candidatus Marinimicrobia bacterium]|nr:trigger factor [Candidatus Neomarinimicrobiota bacterium]